MTKGMVVWSPKGIHWFCVVEDFKMSEGNKRAGGYGAKPQGQGLYKVIELVHPMNREMRAVGEPTKDKDAAIKEAERLNGDMHVYYTLKGAFIDIGEAPYVAGRYVNKSDRNPWVNAP